MEQIYKLLYSQMMQHYPNHLWNFMWVKLLPQITEDLPKWLY